MPRQSLSRLSLFAVLVALLVAVPSYAGKRRAVAHPSSGDKITATVTGTVVDAVTGMPVIAATIHWHGGTAATDAQGKFRLRNIYGHGKIALTAERSGYTQQTAEVGSAGDHQVDFRLQPTPTVRVRKVDGTTHDIDFESVKFGYAVPFSGYIAAEWEAFCRPDGTAVEINRSEIRKINGPATLVTHAACCSTSEVLKVNLQLKSGEVTDMYFSDSCSNANKMDLIGRDHVTGQFHYIRFEQIAEVVFP